MQQTVSVTLSSSQIDFFIACLYGEARRDSDQLTVSSLQQYCDQIDFLCSVHPSGAIGWRGVPELLRRLHRVALSSPLSPDDVDQYDHDAQLLVDTLKHPGGCYES